MSSEKQEELAELAALDQARPTQPLAADGPAAEYTVVHGKAKSFYEHFDFVVSPSDPYHLFRLLKDISAALRS